MDSSKSGSENHDSDSDNEDIVAVDQNISQVQTIDMLQNQLPYNLNIVNCQNVNIYNNAPREEWTSTSAQIFCTQDCNCSNNMTSGIETRHKKILEKNYNYLVKHKVGNSEVLDHLLSSDVLSLEDIERLSRGTSQDRSRRLLGVLPNRGSNAFYAFLSSLEEAGLGFVERNLRTQDLQSFFLHVLCAHELKLSWANYPSTPKPLQSLTAENACEVAEIFAYNIKTVCKQLSRLDAVCIHIFQNLKSLYLHQNLDQNVRLSIHNLNSLPKTPFKLTELYLIYVDFNEEDLLQCLDWNFILLQVLVIVTKDKKIPTTIIEKTRDLANLNHCFLKPIALGGNRKIDQYMEVMKTRFKMAHLNSFFNGSLPMYKIFKAIHAIYEFQVSSNTSDIDINATTADMELPTPPSLLVNLSSLGTMASFTNHSSLPHEVLVIDVPSVSSLDIRYPELISCILFLNSIPDRDTLIMLRTHLQNLTCIYVQESSIENMEKHLLNTEDSILHHILENIQYIYVKSKEPKEIVQCSNLFHVNVSTTAPKLKHISIDAVLEVDYADLNCLSNVPPGTLSCTGIIVRSRKKLLEGVEYMDLHNTMIPANISSLHLIYVPKIQSDTFGSLISHLTSIQVLVVVSSEKTPFYSSVLECVKKLTTLSKVFISPLAPLPAMEPTELDLKLEEFFRLVSEKNCFPITRVFLNGDIKLDVIWNHFRTGNFSPLALPTMKRYSSVDVNFNESSLLADVMLPTTSIGDYSPMTTTLRDYRLIPSLITTYDIVSCLHLPSDDFSAALIWETFPNLNAFKCGIAEVANFPKVLNFLRARPKGSHGLCSFYLNFGVRIREEEIEGVQSILSIILRDYLPSLEHLYLWGANKLYIEDILLQANLKTIQFGWIGRNGIQILRSVSKSSSPNLRCLESIYLDGVKMSSDIYAQIFQDMTGMQYLKSITVIDDRSGDVNAMLSSPQEDFKLVTLELNRTKIETVPLNSFLKFGIALGVLKLKPTVRIDFDIHILLKLKQLKLVSLKNFNIIESEESAKDPSISYSVTTIIFEDLTTEEIGIQSLSTLPTTSDISEP